MKRESLRHNWRPQGRAAFTLVELLVVIGLMAMLGTISVGGYFAAVRGMTDRGAKQDTVSLIRLAMQTALIDQKPTAVLFYNRRTQDEDTASGEDTGAEIVGMAVAIKMAGRISLKEDNILVDEFADWNQSYPMSDKTSSDVGIRFYRMTDFDKSKKGLEECSSLMNPWVSSPGGKDGKRSNLNDEWLAAAGIQLGQWCDNYKKMGVFNRDFPVEKAAPEVGNNQRWGFGFHSKNDGLGSSGWNVGDAYGMEIASLQLPKGYIFGNNAPKSTRIESERSMTLYFNPSKVSNENKYEFDINSSIKISAYRPKGLVQVDTIDKSDLKDD